MMLENLLILWCAYCIGSLSFAVIVSRVMGMEDPRAYGSGNPGATNVLRSGKKMAALLTLLGDGAKGWLAVFAVSYYQNFLGIGEIMIVAVAIVVLLGHMWPIFFGFKGGKGVATAAGVLLALSWPTALSCAVIWLVMAFGLKISSLAALTATSSAPLVAWYWGADNILIIGIIMISLLILYRHKSNILNLKYGSEDKIGETKH